MSHASKVSRRGLLTGAISALAVGSVIGQANANQVTQIFRRGYPQIPISLPTFQLVEHSGGTSLGFKRIGLPIRSGDVPAAFRLGLQRNGVAVAAQFDNRSSWWDGSGFKYMTCCIRDAGFSASESRAYTPIVEHASFDNTSSLDLPTALAGTDFKVKFTSVSGSTSGALNNHTASLNDQFSARSVTRVTKYESGPVCDSWVVWGMAVDDVTAAEHAHLKTNWYISAWKNANGSIAAREVCAIVALDWWSIAGAEMLTYAAALQNGVTVLDTYGGMYDSDGTQGPIKHPYGSQWGTVRLANDNEHAARHWVGANRPTLLYKPDRDYWKSTGLVPYLDTTIAYVTPAALSSATPGVSSVNHDGTLTYQPGLYQACSPQSHRGWIDGTGGYNGRGQMTNFDCIAFSTQSALDVRVARLNAWAGPHFPGHYRSNKTRTRPGDGGTSDTANTICPLIISDGVTTQSDFTSSGMPVSAHAYISTLTDGYVTRTGGTDVSNGAATNKWLLSSDNSHLAPYSFYTCLLEGEQYLLQAVIDHAAYSVQKWPGNVNFGLPPLAFVEGFTFVPIYPGMSTTPPWAAISMRYTQGNERSTGWSALIAGQGAIIPDADVQRPYYQAWATNLAKWTAASVAFVPARNNGFWNPLGGQACSPFEEYFICLGHYAAYDLTRDANWLPGGHLVARTALSWAVNDYIGQCDCFHGASRPSEGTRWSTTNQWYDGFYYELAPGCPISSSRISHTHTYFNYTAGDRVVPLDEDDAGNVITIPAELTIGQEYFIVNPIGKTSFQIAATPGGAPISFADYTNASFGILLQAAQGSPSPSIFTFTTGDVRPLMARMIAIMAARHGHPLATPPVIAKFNAVTATIPRTDWATWSFSST